MSQEQARELMWVLDSLVPTPISKSDHKWANWLWDCRENGLITDNEYDAIQKLLFS